MQPPPPPRFQFSLRTALLLMPVLAGLVYLHVVHQNMAVVVDLCLLDCAVIYAGFSMRETTVRWKVIVGWATGYLACFVLLALFIRLSLFFFLPLRR